MFQHCHPMRNHDTVQLQEGNRKINSEKVSGQSSSTCASIIHIHGLNTDINFISIVKKFAVWRDGPACGQGRGVVAAAASDVV